MNISIANSDDSKEILGIMMSVFAKTEPTSMALNIPDEHYRRYAEYIIDKGIYQQQIFIAKNDKVITGYAIWEDYEEPLVLGLPPNKDIYKMIEPELEFVNLLENELDNIIDFDKSKCMRISQAAVLPHYQGQGIAKALINFIIKENSIIISEKNYKFVIADCTVENSFTILNKLGFDSIIEINYVDFTCNGFNPYKNLNGIRRLMLKKNF
ncbi:MAG: GNAT family N-acetyltransferase [Candidatus Kapabacteria bacterium]|nr:GNAT family N-acetyltransferase [Candidatus Kapabacteria bacterium]